MKSRWPSSKKQYPGDTVKAYVNGKFMNETTGCTITNGFIGSPERNRRHRNPKMFLEPLPSPAKP